MFRFKHTANIVFFGFIIGAPDKENTKNKVLFVHLHNSITLNICPSDFAF